MAIIICGIFAVAAVIMFCTWQARGIITTLRTTRLDREKQHIELRMKESEAIHRQSMELEQARNPASPAELETRQVEANARYAEAQARIAEAERKKAEAEFSREKYRDHRHGY